LTATVTTAARGAGGLTDSVSDLQGVNIAPSHAFKKGRWLGSSTSTRVTQPEATTTGVGRLRSHH
jgi:hypothetical protein